jgi:hypothetical protein
VVALADALRKGALGSGLKQLRIGSYQSGITLAGATALGNALDAGGQHMQKLEELQFMTPSLGGDETRAFLERALAACRGLTTVRLRRANLSDVDAAALQAVMKAERGARGLLEFDRFGV